MIWCIILIVGIRMPDTTFNSKLANVGRFSYEQGAGIYK